jgi:hypothetical protein
MTRNEHISSAAAGSPAGCEMLRALNLILLISP